MYHVFPIDEFSPNFEVSVLKSTNVRLFSCMQVVGHRWYFVVPFFEAAMSLQSLWQLHISWDGQLPDTICTAFVQTMEKIFYDFKHIEFLEVLHLICSRNLLSFTNFAMVES